MSRRFTLTLGLFSTLSCAAFAQAVQPPASDDGPVAITTRTNVKVPVAEAPKLPQKNALGGLTYPILNNQGEVVFHARYATGKSMSDYVSAYFINKPDGTWTIFEGADKGLNFSEKLISLGNVSTSGKGDLIFSATLDRIAPSFKVSGGEKNVSEGAKQSGIFTKTSEGIKSIYLMGQEIPNNPATYIGFAGTSMNSKGTIAFVGTYADPDGRGLFILEDGKLKIVARSGQRTPIGPDSSYSEHFYPSAINEKGEVAFFCRVSGGGAIFVRRAAGIEAVAVQENPSPVEGTHFIGFANRNPAINNKGDVVFAAFIGDDVKEAPVMDANGQVIPSTKPTKSGRGLFIREAGSTQTKVVAMSGDTLPESKATFSDFLMPSVNANGDIVFLANYAGRARGIFLKTKDGIEAIALYEKTAPGLDRKDEGNGFNNFQNPIINDRGDITFLGQLRKGPVGIFVKRKGEELKMIARSGEVGPIK